MKKIDDLFKKGLETGGLPYKEEYWQNMEAILDKKIPVTSRKKPVIWLILGISVAIMATIIFFLFPSHNSEKSELTSSKSVARSTETPDASKFKSIENENPESKTIIRHKDLAESAIENHDGKNIHYPVNTEEESATTQDNTPESMPEYAEIEIPGSRKPIDYLGLKMKVLDFITYDLKQNPFHSASKNIRKVPFFSQYIGFHYDHVQYALSGRNLHQESSFKGQHLGIDYRIQRKKWFLMSGVQIGTYSLKTNYTSTLHQVTYDTTFRLLNKQYTQTPRGTRVALVGHTIDSTVVNASRTDCPNCAVKLQYVSIPLRLGYEWAYRRVRINPSLGVRVNFFSKGIGGLANPNVFIQEEGWQKMQETDLSMAHYMSNYFPQVGYAIGLNYRLSSRLDFRGEYLQWNATSSVFLHSDAKLKENGLSLGLMYRIR